MANTGLTKASNSERHRPQKIQCSPAPWIAATAITITRGGSRPTTAAGDFRPAHSDALARAELPAADNVIGRSATSTSVDTGAYQDPAAFFTSDAANPRPSVEEPEGGYYEPGYLQVDGKGSAEPLYADIEDTATVRSYS